MMKQCYLAAPVSHPSACNIKRSRVTSYNYDLQYGFRDRKFCKARLISLLDDLTLNYDKSLQTDLKAFDIYACTTSQTCLRAELVAMIPGLHFESFLTSCTEGSFAWRILNPPQFVSALVYLRAQYYTGPNSYTQMISQTAFVTVP